MKYKTFYMTRDHDFMPWCIDKMPQPFICSREWEKMFNHLRHRKSLRLTVHTHPVKGSTRFEICHPHPWTYRLVGQATIFLAMSMAIKNILSMYGKDKMYVWVTFK